MRQKPNGPRTPRSVSDSSIATYGNVPFSQLFDETWKTTILKLISQEFRPPPKKKTMLPNCQKSFFSTIHWLICQKSRITPCFNCCFFSSESLALRFHTPEELGPSKEARFEPPERRRFCISISSAVTFLKAPKVKLESTKASRNCTTPEDWHFESKNHLNKNGSVGSMFVFFFGGNHFFFSLAKFDHKFVHTPRQVQNCA